MENKHMCLAVPGKVVEIFDEDGLRMGRIDYEGTQNTTCLEYLPEAEVGQYVIVHAGFAISILDEDEALETLELWKSIYEISQ
jgi:hydrogenase expression/formation protein HypC